MRCIIQRNPFPGIFKVNQMTCFNAASPAASKPYFFRLCFFSFSGE